MDRTSSHKLAEHLLQLQRVPANLRTVHPGNIHLIKFGWFFPRLSRLDRFFFKENVSNPVWTCRDPISLIIGTRFSLILGTRFEILGTRIGSLKPLKKPCALNSTYIFLVLYHPYFNLHVDKKRKLVERQTPEIDTLEQQINLSWSCDTIAFVASIPALGTNCAVLIGNLFWYGVW